MPAALCITRFFSIGIAAEEEQLQFHPLFFDVEEIAVGFVDQLIEGEGVVILGENITEIHQLMAIYYAQKHGFLRVAVCADGVQFGGAVSELIRDGGDDLIGVGGNNGELVGCLGTL